MLCTNTVPLQTKLSIYISGAHSVGKTTLQEALQRNEDFIKFGFKCQHEIARTWVQEQGYTQEMLKSEPTFRRLQRELVNLQIAKETTEIADNGGLDRRFLWDRGIIDPIAYTKVFCGGEEVEKILAIPTVKTGLLRLQKGEDVLLLVPEPREELLSFDGVRMETDMNDINRIHDAMVSLMTELQIPHLIIKDFEIKRRTEFVIKQVKLKWPWLVTK